MVEVRIPVSVGELIDKISILRIKGRRIPDAEKQRNIRVELDALLAVCRQAGIDPDQALSAEIEAINSSLWEIEDQIRELERKKDFGAEFVRLARAVYVTNDRRFEVKAKINAHSGSKFREEKSYQPY